MHEGSLIHVIAMKIHGNLVLVTPIPLLMSLLLLHGPLQMQSLTMEDSQVVLAPFV